MSSTIQGVIGIEVVVPLRRTVQTAMTSRRPRRERELLNLGFVNRLQGVVCEPLKLGTKYYVYKPFFFSLREICAALNSLSKVL